MEGLTWSHDFKTFAKQVVWFPSEEQQGEKYPFLVLLMARGPRSAYEHARKVFGFTDEDFREALRQAKPGVFMTEERWERWNKELGFVPPLPLPRRMFRLTQQERKAVKEEAANGADIAELAEKYSATRANIEEALAEA